MRLDGSCHCKRVTFQIESDHPYPFNLCYCSICRKTAGGGGFAINLGGIAQSLCVSGESFISIYRALEDSSEKESLCERRFCKICGSALWVWDSRWPELIHPFASAIDTPLPIPPSKTHLMLGSKKEWVEVDVAQSDLQFSEYPDESIAQWHRKHNL